MSNRRAEHTSISGWLTQVVAWSVITAMVLVLAVSVVIPRLAGAYPYTIVTGSMRPGMPPGTLVVVRPINAADIRIGMVVTYQLKSGQPAVVTHRVVGQGYNAKGDLVFRTQGDANDIADERPVLPVQIKGERWYAVPHLGHVTNAVTSSQRRAAVTIVAVGLLGYAVLMFAGAARDRRKTHDTSNVKVRS